MGSGGCLLELKRPGRDRIRSVPYISKNLKKLCNYFIRGERNKNLNFASFHTCQNISLLDLESHVLYLRNKFLQIEFDITLQAVCTS